MADIRVDIQMKNADVNSGAYFNLSATDFAVSLGKNVEANALVAGNSSFRLPVGTNLGINTPGFTINGCIDSDLYSAANIWSSSAQTLSDKLNVVTLGMLYYLYKSKADTYIKITFSSTNDKNWYNYKTNSIEIKVLISSIDLQPDTGSEGLHMINYKMTLIEVEP